MKLEGADYRLSYENGILAMGGRISLMLEDYDRMEAFFKQVIQTGPRSLTLDIRDLAYLNSSGIKTLCVSLILEAAEAPDLRLKILCADRYSWQRETIPTFQGLMDRIEIAFY